MLRLGTGIRVNVFRLLGVALLLLVLVLAGVSVLLVSESGGRGRGGTGASAYVPVPRVRERGAEAEAEVPRGGRRRRWWRWWPWGNNDRSDSYSDRGGDRSGGNLNNDPQAENQAPNDPGIQRYDIYGPVRDPFSSECIRLPLHPPLNPPGPSAPPDPPWVCIHPPGADRFISGALKAGELWEAEATALFVELLQRNPELGVLDIGANIGQYALLAAWLGRWVVAVDARLAHIQMLHHSAVLNGYQARLLLLHNAVTDTRDVMSLQLSRDNQGATRVINVRPPCIAGSHCPGVGAGAGAGGRNPAYHVGGVTMDDLLEVVHFQNVLVKIHIEGDEGRALLHGSRFLQDRAVPFLLVEWEGLRGQGRGLGVGAGEDVVDLLHTLGYEAFDVNKRRLQNDEFQEWPNDVVWKHQNVDF